MCTSSTMFDTNKDQHHHLYNNRKCPIGTSFHNNSNNNKTIAMLRRRPFVRMKMKKPPYLTSLQSIDQYINTFNISSIPFCLLILLLLTLSSFHSVFGKCKQNKNKKTYFFCFHIKQ